MGASDWNWRLPAEHQDVPWDCAAASLTWCLNAMGIPISEAEVVAGLGPTRISPTHGLLDASGAGLVSYCAELGITAHNNPDALWEELETAAGFQPMLIGGRSWYHWTGVRMGGTCMFGEDLEQLLLANPAPGYGGVSNVLTITDFEQLGAFSAVWLLPT